MRKIDQVKIKFFIFCVNYKINENSIQFFQKFYFIFFVLKHTSAIFLMLIYHVT